MNRFVLLAAALLSGCHEPNVLVAVSACNAGSFTLTAATPSVMLVLDRSGSMEKSFGSGTRWSTLATSLSATLPQVDGTLELGAYLFPAEAAQACSVPGAPALEPALGNVAALQRLLATTTPAGATPTADAIDAAAEALDALATEGTAKALVLATDGAPNCSTATCTSGDACLDDARAASRLAAHAANGMPTWVIGIDINSDVLTRLAIAGGAAHSYYSAASREELTAAFTDVRERLNSCVFFTPSVPDEGGSISVALDGAPADWEWVLQTTGELRLRGASCETAIAATRPMAVSVTVSCSDVDATLAL